MVTRRILVSIIRSALFVIFLFVITGCSQKFTVKLFFADKNFNYLKYEHRKVVCGYDIEKDVYNIVEELLAGPVNPELKSIFNSDSKVLNVRIDGNTVEINLNKDSVSGNNYYKLAIFSIVNTVRLHYSSLRYFKFYFDGEKSDYIGDLVVPQKGFEVDYKYFKK